METRTRELRLPSRSFRFRVIFTVREPTLETAYESQEQLSLALSTSGHWFRMVLFTASQQTVHPLAAERR